MAIFDAYNGKPIIDTGIAGVGIISPDANFMSKL
jgi:hypothetical protein